MTDEFDTGVAHPARRYNYWLGGTDNFAADRESGDQLARSYPAARIAARANRAFLQRAVRHVFDAGVRQFLDIGTGLPGAGNTHEMAPGARVVHVDNDPLVTAHARALGFDYLEEDLRNPAKILAAADLDYSAPIGLVLVAVVHFLPSASEIVRTLGSALPPGSYLIMSAATTDLLTPELKANRDESLRTGRSDVHPRTQAEFTSYFDGLSLVPPGVVPVADWRPDPASTEHPSPVDASIFGAVGRLEQPVCLADRVDQNWLDLPASRVDEAARLLLGRHLTANGVTARLTEVEAYSGLGEDPASHAHRGMTSRNAVMFGPAGHLYVYQIYGMYLCANIVCGEVGRAAAVLLRAGEVIEGFPYARERRPAARKDTDLAAGPAKLMQVLALDRTANGSSVIDGTGPLLLSGDAADPSLITAGPRVGVTSAHDVAWRFWIAGDPTVSAYRRHVPRKRPPVG